MRDTEPQQVFVRNDRGRRWGPIAPATLEILLENGLIEGRIQISVDGENFTWPGRVPEIRDYVPHALWGDGVPAPATVAPSIAPVQGQSPMPVPARATPPGGHPPPPRAAPDIAAPTRGRAVTPAPPAVAPPPPATATVQPSASPSVGALDGPPAAGDLSVVSPVRLYYLAASADATGLLTLRMGQHALEIHFRKGSPEHVDSTHPEDALGGFLLRQGLATPEQLAQVEPALPRFGGELMATLFGLGVLNPTTAFGHLAQRAHGILVKALLTTAGLFEWTPKELPPHKAMPLGHRWAVLMEVLRRVPAAEFRQRLGALVDHPVMKSGGRVALNDLRLTPQETRAISYVDGVRSLALLAHDLPQDADSFFRLAWVLQQMEIVSFAAVKLPPPPPAAPAPAPAPATGRVPGPPPAASKPAAAAPPPRARTPPAPAAAPKHTVPPAPVDFATE